MSTDITFIDPPPDVQCARLAMARLEQHLFTVIGSLDPECALFALSFAFLTLEEVNPPYPPLPPVAPSTDPPADLALAVHHLTAASRHADRAVEILRYARAIRDLRALADSPHLTAAGSVNGTAWTGDDGLGDDGPEDDWCDEDCCRDDFWLPDGSSGAWRDDSRCDGYRRDDDRS